VLVRRSVAAGPGTTTIVLRPRPRPRPGAALPRTGGPAVPATFAQGATVRRIALR
jgi:hypothetical protein